MVTTVIYFSLLWLHLQALIITGYLFEDEKYTIIQYNQFQYEKLSLRGIKGMYALKRHDINDTIYSQSNKAPSFIHIPKTGGTSIETTLLFAGVRVGQFAFSDGFLKAPVNLSNIHDVNRTYPIIENFEPYKVCSLFHIPSKTFVPNSITTMRHPFDRLYSEWCHHLHHHNKLGRLSGYQITCQSFSNFVRNLLRIYKAGEEGIADCHWIPQSTFARNANIIIPFDYLRSGYFWNDMMRVFNTTNAMNPIYAKETSCSRKFLPTWINMTCLEPKVFEEYNEFVREDMELYSLLRTPE